MGLHWGRRLAATAAAAVLPSLVGLDAAGRAAPRYSAADAPPSVPGQASPSLRSSAGIAAGPMQLQVRRLGDSVELVVVGVGPAPQLQQLVRPNGWQGQLTTASPTGLRAGGQRLSLPELGFQSVSLDGSGSSYSLAVTPMPGVPLARPVVSADGVNLILTFPASRQVSLQTNRLDLSQPGAVPLPTYAPPLQARAVAPPLGDMAVGSMIVRSAGALQLSGPRVTLTLRNAPVRDALMTLARLGNYGFVYLPESLSDSEEGKRLRSEEELKRRYADQDTDAGRKYVIGPDSQYTLRENPRPVTVSFAGESYSNAVNAVLAAGGLQGRLQGKTIFAGPNMLALATYGPQITKIYRLNQAAVASAAQYLASLGALISVPQTISSVQSTGSSTNTGSGASNGGTTSSSTNTSTSQAVEIQSFGSKRGPLLGVTGTIDSRLGTITLVGDAYSVNIAENYLRQIDLRQRQVALSVKILDVNLNNNTEIANSFAFKSGNTFILNDNGRLSATFGSAEITASGAANPGLAYPDQSFIDTLRAVILSNSSKVLASPTLILSENADFQDDKGSQPRIGRQNSNESYVTVGEKLVISYSPSYDSNGNITACIPVFENAGLEFGARVSKIDDNGYVTFALSPQISAAVGVPQEVRGCGPIRVINRRKLDTGSVRVRDGQTLILTGVISDDVQAAVSKWPILGDIPFIGQFFRGSSSSRKKTELIIMVTPRIINDGDSSGFGYGFQPSTPEARQFMQ